MILVLYYIVQEVLEVDSKNYKINLSKILGEKRITRRQLSLMTGIRGNTIGDLYNEEAKVISFENLFKICKALDIKISDLIELLPEDNDKASE